MKLFKESIAEMLQDTSMGKKIGGEWGGIRSRKYRQQSKGNNIKMKSYH